MNRNRSSGSQQVAVRPCSTEAEKEILSDILSYSEHWVELSPLLHEDSFYDGDCQKIFRFIRQTAESGQTPDLVSVSQHIQMQDQGLAIELIPKIADLASVTSHNPLQTAKVLEHFRQQRLYLELGERLSFSAAKMTPDELSNIVLTYQQKMVSSEASKLHDKTSINKIITDMVAKNQSGQESTGRTFTYFKILDEEGGFLPSKVITVAAMTSQGKALRMTEPILTTNGWVMNKDLKVGDSLCSVDGEPSVVTGIYPQGVKEFYRITFADGRVADCSGDHLWEINVKGNKHPMVISTLGIKHRLEKTGRTQSMWTPAFEGHCGNHKEFVVHPYILGVLLGDGCLTKGVVFASADDYVVEKCKELTKVPLKAGNENRTAKTYRFSFGHTGHHGEDNPLWMEMKRLGLLGHRANGKFIPDEYMEAEKDQRENLLNGLMDTDGEIDEYGSIHYSSVSERLAKDVQRLCWSLGYKASLYRHKSAIGEKTYQDHYRVTISGDNESRIFTLPRRKKRVRVRSRVKNVIQSVEYIGQEECQCIKVSHPRELFVMGDYIVTHNTALALTFAYNAMLQGQSVAIYSMEMSKESIGVRFLNIAGLRMKEYQVMYERILQPQAVTEAANSINAMSGNYYVDDKANTSIDKILESIRLMVKRNNIVGAIVDYIQILNVYDKSGKSQEQILADAARRLQEEAKASNIWILILSQISRSKEDGANHDPSADKIRGSGQILEAMDMNILLYRPEVYGESFPSPYSEVDTKNTALLKLTKCRGGASQKSEVVHFYKEQTYFKAFDDTERLPISGLPQSSNPPLPF